MKVNVTVTLKQGVLDTAGRAVADALGHMNETCVDSVRIGKFIEIELSESDHKKAKAEVERMCQNLLANPVIENYTIQIDQTMPDEK